MSETTHDLTQRLVDRRQGSEGSPCARYQPKPGNEYGYGSCNNCGWGEPEHIIDALSAALVQAEAVLESIGDVIKGRDTSDFMLSFPLVSAVVDALVQAEQEKASKEAMLAAIIGALPNAPTHLQFADFIGYLQRLATQEATIRQVVESMDAGIRHSDGAIDPKPMVVSATIQWWIKTLRAILPAEQEKS